jgi:hypothetical protein
MGGAAGRQMLHALKIRRAVKYLPTLILVVVGFAVAPNEVRAQNRYTALGDSWVRGTNAADGSDTPPRTGYVDAVDDVSNSVERFLDNNCGTTELNNFGARGATASIVSNTQLPGATSGTVGTGAPDVATLSVDSNDVSDTAHSARSAQLAVVDADIIETTIVAPRPETRSARDSRKRIIETTIVAPRLTATGRCLAAGPLLYHGKRPRRGRQQQGRDARCAHLLSCG